MQVLERERTRIAQELHAGAGQPLAGIKMNLDLLEQSLTQMPLEAQAAMTRLRALADDALEQIRVVSHHLQPPEWQKLTTEAALRTLVRTSGILNRYKTTVRIELPAAELPHRIKVALYRCAQESIANVIRHSEATSLNLSVTADTDRSSFGLRIMAAVWLRANRTILLESGLLVSGCARSTIRRLSQAAPAKFSATYRAPKLLFYCHLRRTDGIATSYYLSPCR